MTTKKTGIIATILSAIIFGFTPILARISYDGGANGITITFLRATLSLPVLLGILLFKKISFKVTKKQIVDILIAGVIGASCTTILLYMSYSFISVGTSTTLHFIYPLLVATACVLFFKEKISPLKVSAVLVGTLGIAMFFERSSSQNKTGIILALLSGVTYAFYMIFLDRSTVKHLHYYLLSFYLCITMAVSAGVFGTITGTLTFQLTPKAWILALLVSLLTSVGALSLLQVGIRMVGASTAALFSTLEPITSMALGVLILGEELTPLKLAGAAFIIASVLLITYAESRVPASQAS